MFTRTRTLSVAWATACVSLSLGAGCTEVHELDDATAAYLPAADMSAYVPAVSIAADSAAFADMLHRYEEDIVLRGSVSLWRGGEIVFAERRAKLKVKGNFSSKFPLKSIGVNLGREIANRDGRAVRVPHVKPAHTLGAVKALRLRNGGNAFTASFVKDLAFARVVAASDLDVLPVYGEPAAAYVNDAFYGLCNLRTEHSATGISRLLDVDKERVWVASVRYADPVAVKSGPVAFWRDLEAAVDRGDAEAVHALLDEDSFVDFLVGGAVLGAHDWPYGNVRMYSVAGGPVRFVLYDFDLASRYHPRATPHEHVEHGTDNPIRRIYRLCLTLPGFAERLRSRYREVLEGRELAPRRLRDELESLSRAYDPVIAHQTARYGYPTSAAQWYVDLEAVAEDYERRYRSLDGAWR